MSLIWILIALLVIAVVTVIVAPLLRARDTTFTARAIYDVAIYKDQLKEAEREFDRGLLSAEQLDAVKTEIQRKLLAAAGPSDLSGTAPLPQNPQKWATGIGLALFLAAGSLGLYSYLGSPALDNMAYADRDIEKEQQAQNNRDGNDKAIAEMTTLVDRLEAKLAENPDNLEGWLMLGRSATSLGQYPRAILAYEAARKLDPESPTILVDYAETIIFRDEGRVSEQALQALQQARRLNAANPKARYYIALASAQAGDLKKALQEWTDLLAISLPDAPWRQTVEAQIAAAAEETKIDPKTLTPSTEAQAIGADIKDAAQAQATAPGPTREDVEAVSKMSAEDREQMIRSMVERLADRLKDAPNDRQGWLRLAKAYEVLGETEKAAHAMEQANAATQ